MVLEFVCPICMEEYTSTDEIYSTRCGHVFHGRCLDDWFRHRMHCPECLTKGSERSRIYPKYNELSGAVALRTENVTHNSEDDDEDLEELKDEVKLAKQANNVIETAMLESESNVVEIFDQLGLMQNEREVLLNNRSLTTAIIASLDTEIENLRKELLVLGLELEQTKSKEQFMCRQMEDCAKHINFLVGSDNNEETIKKMRSDLNAKETQIEVLQEKLRLQSEQLENETKISAALIVEKMKLLKESNKCIAATATQQQDNQHYAAGAYNNHSNGQNKHDVNGRRFSDANMQSQYFANGQAKGQQQYVGNEQQQYFANNMPHAAIEKQQFFPLSQAPYAPQYVVNTLPQYVANSQSQCAANAKPQYVSNAPQAQYAANAKTQYVGNEQPTYFTNQRTSYESHAQLQQAAHANTQASKSRMDYVAKATNVLQANDMDENIAVGRTPQDRPTKATLNYVAKPTNEANVAQEHPADINNDRLQHVKKGRAQYFAEAAQQYVEKEIPKNLEFPKPILNERPEKVAFDIPKTMANEMNIIDNYSSNNNSNPSTNQTSTAANGLIFRGLQLNDEPLENMVLHLGWQLQLEIDVKDIATVCILSWAEMSVFVEFHSNEIRKKFLTNRKYLKEYPETKGISITAAGNKVDELEEEVGKNSENVSAKSNAIINDNSGDKSSHNTSVDKSSLNNSGINSHNSSSINSDDNGRDKSSDKGSDKDSVKSSVINNPFRNGNNNANGYKNRGGNISENKGGSNIGGFTGRSGAAFIGSNIKPTEMPIDNAMDHQALFKYANVLRGAGYNIVFQKNREVFVRKNKKAPIIQIKDKQHIDDLVGLNSSRPIWQKTNNANYYINYVVVLIALLAVSGLINYTIY